MSVDFASQLPHRDILPSPAVPVYDMSVLVEETERLTPDFHPTLSF